MTNSPLLPVVIKRLEPIFDEMRQAGMDEASAATVMGRLSQRVVLEVLEDLMSADGMSQQLLDQAVSIDDQEDQLSKLNVLFMDHLGQDIQTVVQAKAEKMTQEFNQAG